MVYVHLDVDGGLAQLPYGLGVRADPQLAEDPGNRVYVGAHTIAASALGPPTLPHSLYSAMTLVTPPLLMPSRR